MRPQDAIALAIAVADSASPVPSLGDVYVPPQSAGTAPKRDQQKKHTIRVVRGKRQKHSLKVRTAASKQQSLHHPSPRPNRRGKVMEVVDE